MKSLIFTCSILILTVLVSFALDPRDYLPASDEVGGWRTVETRIFRSDNELFDYMDGGAEIYIAFNFRKLAVREFAGSEGFSIIMEIYQFKESADAFGVFSLLPMEEQLEIGNGGGYDLGIVCFWKGQFFCRVFHTSDYGLHRDLLLRAAKAVDSKISQHGAIPAMVALLPTTDLTPGKVRYFHEYIAQKNLLYIVPWNLFNLTRQTEAVMGEYFNTKAEKVYLFLVKYPTAAAADCAYQDILTRYLKTSPPKSGQHLRVSLEQSRTVEIDRWENYLLFGIEDSHQQLLAQRMKDLQERVKRQK